MRLAVDKANNADRQWGFAERSTPMFGGRYVDPTSRRPKESDMEDCWRSNGILHGRNVTTGLDERPDV